MSIPDLLTRFLIDKWYKLTAYVSAIVLVLALFYTTQGIENTYVISICVGVFLYSVVEWSQYKPRTAFQDRGFGSFLTAKWHEKELSIFDVALKIVALLFITVPLLKIICGIDVLQFLR